MKQLILLIAFLVWLIITLIIVCSIIGLFLFVIDDGFWMEIGNDLKDGLLVD